MYKNVSNYKSIKLIEQILSKLKVQFEIKYSWSY